MTDLHKIWRDNAECVSQVHQLEKKIKFKNPTWWTIDTIETRSASSHNNTLTKLHCYNRKLYISIL